MSIPQPGLILYTACKRHACASCNEVNCAEPMRVMCVVSSTSSFLVSACNVRFVSKSDHVESARPVPEEEAHLSTRYPKPPPGPSRKSLSLTIRCGPSLSDLVALALAFPSVVSGFVELVYIFAFLVCSDVEHPV